MYMALQMEDRFPLIDILEQTPASPDSCQWAIFLRNHDELTLEMVTDEERDYMYRVYASDPRARINLGIRRRLAPLLANSRRRIELMNFLLFSLPGTPIIYYGDEIGMGDNYYLGDRDGVRTPMQWSPDRNAGFSRVNPQRLYMPVVIEPEYHFESVNVENQVSNTTSLLWWMRRVISMRKRLKALGSGTMEMLLPDNPKVLAFIRSQGDEILLVVVNLSRFAQVARLDLSGYAGLVPEEVFSRNLYPVIRKEPYILTLGVHDYYWFHLRPTREQMLETELPRLSLRSGSPWEAVLQGKTGERFADLIADYLPRCRWFRSNARLVSQVELVDSLPLGTESRASRLVLFKVSYTEGLAETYLLPLAWLPREQAERLLEEEPRARIAFLNLGDEEGMLFDAVHDEDAVPSVPRLVARWSD
jgi:maltose alpha-D-glucosyltransferase/alpha-amylase